MQLRNYVEADISQISRLYFFTVRTINSRDYSKEQIEAWAPEIYPDSYWKERWNNDYTVLVAEENNQIVGFAEFRSNGEVDCFYVHHEWQGMSVGSKLMNAIERIAKRKEIARIFADVSLTAKPFFAAKGFEMIREQTKGYRGQSFQQFYMEKVLLGK
jgi:putative acetyltransferase